MTCKAILIIVRVVRKDLDERKLDKVNTCVCSVPHSVPAKKRIYIHIAIHNFCVAKNPDERYFALLLHKNNFRKRPANNLT